MVNVPPPLPAANPQQSAPPAQPQPEPQTPRWLKETPEDHIYFLEIMCPDQAGFAEEIRMTRAEYIALKRHLATMRGLPLPPAA